MCGGQKKPATPASCRFALYFPFGRGKSHQDVSHQSAHAPEMKPEHKQEQAVTPRREIAQQQEQVEDFGLGL
jgi:hypothetical protein